MKIALVNLITKTADVQADASVLYSADLRPKTHRDLNIVETGRRLSARGHDVTIYVSDVYRPRTEEDLGDVVVEYLPTRLPWLFPPSLAPLTPSLSSVLRREKADVVQSGEVFQPGTMLSWTATREPNTEMFVWQELDTYMRGPVGWVQRRFYGTFGQGMVKGCRAIIPRSRSARRHLVDIGFPEEKMAPVVHSGVDTTVFRPMNKHESRERFGIEEDRNVLLSVGRLHPNKGMDILVRTMCKMRSGDPDCLLIIKGTGPQEEQLRSMVHSMKLDDNVQVMTDHLSAKDMAALYNCADLLTVASRVDLFPFTAIEAISCGVPVATSFARGLKTDIVEQGAGVMMASDPDDMAADLQSMLEDPVKLDQLGKKARELARRDFDFEVGADRLLSIYSGECAG